MTHRLALAAWLLIFLPMCLTGCSSSSEPSSGGGAPSDRASGEPKTIREVPARQLASLADPSPTSDPAVQASGPEDWKRLPRKDDHYLIGWYGGSNPNILPRIFVRAEDWTGDAEDTTKTNVSDLATEIEQSLTAKKNQVIEWPQAMLLGGEPWVRHVEHARLGNARAEKQVLNRVVGGRLYTVELQIYVGKILEARDRAYAVAAGLTFSPSEPAQEAPSDAEPFEAPSTDDADSAPSTDEETSSSNS